MITRGDQNEVISDQSVQKFKFSNLVQVGFHKPVKTLKSSAQTNSGRPQGGPAQFFKVLKLVVYNNLVIYNLYLGDIWRNMPDAIQIHKGV